MTTREERRQMLYRKIAEQDFKRGRPLTASEKLCNLARSLADDKCGYREWLARFGLSQDPDDVARKPE